MPNYIIQDWAGNILSDYGEFEDFDSGWECIYQNFHEDYFQDLYVVEKEV